MTLDVAEGDGELRAGVALSGGLAQGKGPEVGRRQLGRPAGMGIAAVGAPMAGSPTENTTPGGSLGSSVGFNDTGWGCDMGSVAAALR